MKMAIRHYRALALMSVLSFGAMYVLMYAMVDKFADVYSNLNQAYMAALMTAPMVIIELLVMHEMYQDKRMNVAVIAASVLLLGASFFLIRKQTGISDRQFLRSMIPHHAGAVLMCGKAPVRDPEIRKLCEGIIASQEREIAQMRAKLNALGG